MSASAAWVVVPLLAGLAGAWFAAPARADDLPDFDEMWNYGDPAATEAKFREVLPKAEASGNGEYLAQLWTQIARTLSLRDRFDEAHAILDRVEKSLKDDWRTARVRLLLERGRCFNSAKEPDRARPLFVRAWEISREAGVDGHAVDAAHMVAITHSGEAALDWNRRALALAESSRDPLAQRWVGSLCNNLGYTLLELARYAEATAQFEKGLAWSIERKRPGQARVFRWFLGRTLRLSGKVEEALAAQRKLLEEYESIGEKDGYVHEEIAEALLTLKKPDEAKPHFAKAYELLGKELDPVADAKRLERLRSLGGVAAK